MGQEQPDTIVQVLLWVSGALWAIVTFFGGLYMRKLNGDIRDAKESFVTDLATVHQNCARENQALSAIAERTASVETLMKKIDEDHVYIRTRVDEIFRCMVRKGP